jgi:hypothetical protein
MKTSKIFAACLLLAVATAFAADPGAGLKDTKHDWSSNVQYALLWVDPTTGAATTYNSGVAYIDPGTGKQGKVSISIGMCTKCHTPHQAKSTNLLWNHTLLSTEYQWNVPATTAGTVYPKFKGDTYKGASTKCLSCPRRPAREHGRHVVQPPAP